MHICKIESIIWPSMEFKTSLDIFWPRLEWKRFEEYLVILFRPIGCKKKPWALFLPLAVHLEKQQTRRKSARFYLWLRIFRDTSLSIHVFVNRHSCPFKCFIRLNYIVFLSWLFVMISSLSLFRLLFSVIQEHRIQEYSKCRVYQMNKEFRSNWNANENDSETSSY